MNESFRSIHHIPSWFNGTLVEGSTFPGFNFLRILSSKLTKKVNCNLIFSFKCVIEISFVNIHQEIATLKIKSILKQDTYTVFAFMIINKMKDRNQNPLVYESSPSSKRKFLTRFLTRVELLHNNIKKTTNVRLGYYPKRFRTRFLGKMLLESF